ncbi:MAG: hypothetical protein AAF739_02420 [Pseudomonadota bacterium]
MKKLSATMAACMVAAVVVTEALFLGPSMLIWGDANRAAAIEQVRQAWYHSVAPGTFLTAEQKRQIGRRMVGDGLIEGGVVYDAAGEPVSVFGEQPVLDLNHARISGVKQQQSLNADAFDIHLTPEETGAGHHLILRLPNAPVVEGTRAQAIEFGISVLIVSGGAAVLFLWSALWLVIRPLQRVNTALRNAIGDPMHAADYQLEFSRSDEIGSIGDAVDQLLKSIAAVYQDELAILRAANDAFQFALIQYGPDGQPMAANAAALRLFASDDVVELAKSYPNCASVLGAKKAEPRPILEVLGEGKAPVMLGLHVYAGMVTALGYQVEVKRDADSGSMRFVALVIIDDLMRDARKALLEAKRADARSQAHSAELQEMRRLLESCLCLLEANSSAQDPEQPQSILPDRILNGWYNEAARDGLVSGKLEHGLLPRMKAKPTALRNALRQALLLVYANTTAERPFLKVDAHESDQNTVTISIKDISAMRISGGERRVKSIDPTLPRAALTQALMQAGGQFVDLNISDGETILRISLPSTGQALNPIEGGDALLKAG